MGDFSTYDTCGWISFGINNLIYPIKITIVMLIAFLSIKSIMTVKGN